MNTGQARCGTIITMGLARYQQKETNMIIINAHDNVIGSWHQITIDADGIVRLDGHYIDSHHPFYPEAIRFALAWVDHFEGVTDKEAQCEV